MTRTVPELAIAWTDGVYPRRYVSKASAYYAIAKRLVAEKYPVGLNSEYAVDMPDWSAEKIDARAVKARRLYWNRTESHFDDKRWRAFVTRVARYLAFVDARRGTANRLEARSLADVQKAYERTERAATELATQAARYLAIIKAAEAGR